MNLRLAGIEPESIVDGPGVRLALFFQGCPHRCPGCHNPETHDPRGGSPVRMEQVLALVDASRGLDGVTISGGEPFMQAAGAAGLARAVRARNLNLVLYSGYTFENLLFKSATDACIRALLEEGWLLVDGPYVESERDLRLPYRGSRNQRLVDLPSSLARGVAVEWAGGNFPFPPAAFNEKG